MSDFYLLQLPQKVSVEMSSLQLILICFIVLLDFFCSVTALSDDTISRRRSKKKSEAVSRKVFRLATIWADFYV